MNPMTENSKDSTAAYWALKQQTGVLTDAEQQSFTAWLNESDEHRATFKKTQSILDMTDRASDITDEDTLDAEFSAAIDAPAPDFTWPRALPLIAASAALVFLTVVVWLWGNTTGSILLATAMGEKTEFDLSDGSRATLNTASQIEVDLSQRQRYVSVDRGEVYFDVASDPARPFVVSANDIEIVVIGTKFNVRAISDVTTVSVISGAVKVNLHENKHVNAGIPAEENISLHAGDQLIYRSSTEAVEIHSFDAQRVGAWLNGHAIYDSQPLEYVVADLNRYFPRRLELGDPSLSSIPVSGTFDLTNSAATIEGLAVALSLQRVQTATGAVRLVPGSRQTVEPQE